MSKSIFERLSQHLDSKFLRGCKEEKRLNVSRVEKQNHQEYIKYVRKVWK